jgi:hypothetical protein
METAKRDHWYLKAEDQPKQNMQSTPIDLFHRHGWYYSQVRELNIIRRTVESVVLFNIRGVDILNSQTVVQSSDHRVETYKYIVASSFGMFLN